jgi:hypothetical protein
MHLRLRLKGIEFTIYLCCGHVKEIRNDQTAFASYVMECYGGGEVRPVDTVAQEGCRQAPLPSIGRHEPCPRQRKSAPLPMPVRLLHRPADRQLQLLAVHLDRLLLQQLPLQMALSDLELGRATSDERRATSDERRATSDERRATNLGACF